jgi:hypothetical protein
MTDPPADRYLAFVDGRSYEPTLVDYFAPGFASTRDTS